MKEIYEELLDNIPDYKEFLTVKEMDDSSKALAKKYPETVELFEMGQSREGHPLLCLKIGEGKKNALMFGCPHPNEPIGTMMLEYFTEELAKNKDLRDDLGYTWYIVKAWDADGTKLNENWFKGPYTIKNYARNFFRPAGYKQVDWTFPIEYKEMSFTEPIAETKAMMKLIDDIKPKFIYSLHNAGFGGVYWYLTKNISEIYEDLYKAVAKQNIPLHLGEPEAPYINEFAAAIFEELSIKDNYDYLEKYGSENIGEILNVGDCSAEYARERHDSFTMLTELPYFYDKRIEDTSDSDVLRKDVALDAIKYNQKSNKVIRDIIDISIKYIDKDNPFYLAIYEFTKNSDDDANINMINSNPEFTKLASNAEKFDNTLVKKFYKMLSLGMLVRMNESTIEKMKVDNELNEEKQEKLEKALKLSLKEFNDLADFLEKEIDYEVIPIKKLVSIQLECGIIVANYIKSES